MKILNYINGRFVKSSSDEKYNVYNPYTEKIIATAQKSNEEDARAAVDSARTAFDDGCWSRLLPGERAKILWKIADLVESQSLEFAKLESLNTGKTIKYSRDSDMPFVVDNFRFFAGAARMLEGKASANYTGLGDSIIRREPLGVVAGIIPWNYPLYIATWKLAPALAAGNTIVIKPASYTPLTLMKFLGIAEKAGVPKGVINVITGPGEILGKELASNPKVDMVSLTGDTSTGKKIMEYSSRNIKKVHLELGGKAPLIVMEDCDLEMAAQGAVVGGYWNTGQDCTAVTRVYAHSKVMHRLASRMAEIAKKFKLGDPLNENTDMGPLISPKQRDRVEGYVELAKREGAKVLVGGKKPSHLKKGYFYEPTILTNVAHESRVCQEEIFGPVVSVYGYDKLDHAIEKANDVSYGLAASVYGKDIAQAMKAASQLDFGTVWINEHGALASEMPHGGFKQSGFGKDLSMYSFEEYTRVKHVYIDRVGKPRKPWHYTVYGKKP